MDEVKLANEILITIFQMITFSGGAILLWALIQLWGEVMPHIKIFRKAQYLRKDKFVLLKDNGHLLEKGDYVVFESMTDTNDFSMIGGAGSAFYGHLQKWVMDSDDTKYLFALKKYKTKGKYRDRLAFILTWLDDEGVYVTKKTFHMPEPMAFRLWIEKKEKEKWWYRWLADRSMGVYNRNMGIDKGKRNTNITYEELEKAV